MDVFLYTGEASPNDVRLRDPTVAGGGGSFPTQFFGLRARKTGSTIDLCLVATADAPASMGGVIKVLKGATQYAVYLVETTDPQASPIRVRTATGIKAVRLKT